MRCVARAVTVVVVVLGGLCTVGPAHADALSKPTSREARNHLALGNRLYGIRSFEEAAGEYKAGALVEPAPVFDYNLGQCYRQLAKYQEALWHYERFRTRGSPQGELLDSVNHFITQMSAELDKKKAETRTQPAPVALVSPIGSHAGPRMSTRRKWAIGIGSGGGALVGIGVILGLRARHLQRDADDLCPMVSCGHAQEANALIERAKDNAFHANLAVGIGAAAAVGAAVLWFTSPSTEPGRLALVPQITRTYAGLHAGVRF